MPTTPTYGSSSLLESDSQRHLVKEVRSHEVAIAELNNLPASRAVYQRNGNLFFRTTVQKATASEQSKIFSLCLDSSSFCTNHSSVCYLHLLLSVLFWTEQVDMVKSKLQILSSS
ncbi:hypothetical protein P3S67_015428 [Capsicum chacoense]